MAKKGSKQKPVLLMALKRAIPAIKDDGGHAYIRFSISENGNLKLTGSGPNGSTEEEIPEALVLRPGGPGLLVGEFGVVNLSSEPFDFETDVMNLLPALKKAKSDPSIIFHGLSNVIEFAWPNYKCYISPAVLDAAVR